MTADQKTRVLPKGICPKCQTSYTGAAFCTTPMCKSAKLLPVRSNTARVGEVIDGRYTVLAEVGKGGMGTVYRALQHSMEREVAIKVLNPSISQDEDSVKRFLREAKQASRLNHPHIITLFEFGQSDKNELYLVMELLEGLSLQALLQAQGEIPAERAIDIVRQICEALHYAHSHDIIHRDLKPDNIFCVRKAGQTKDFIKILDFGLAKMQSMAPNQSITAAGVICGTPAYMSPEQALGKPLDIRTDVYSIGIILYEMLAGARPFKGDSPVELLMAQVNQQPPSIREADPSIQVPKSVETVLMRTLAKSPADRPPSAEALSGLFARALKDHDSNPQITSLSTVDTMAGIPSENLEDIEDIASAQTLVSDLHTLSQSEPIQVIDPKSQPKGTVAVARPILFAACGLAIIGALAYSLWPEPQTTVSGNAPVVQRQIKAPTSSQAPAVANQPLIPMPPINRDKAGNVTKEEAKANTSPPPTTVATQIMIEIKTEPDGARITNSKGGEYIGQTPCNMPRPKAGESVRIQIEKEGFQMRRETLSSFAANPVVFRLVEKKKRKRKTQKPSKPKTQKSGGSRILE